MTNITLHTAYTTAKDTPQFQSPVLDITVLPSTLAGEPVACVQPETLLTNLMSLEEL